MEKALPNDAKGARLYPVSIMWEPPFTMMVHLTGHGSRQVRRLPLSHAIVRRLCSDASKPARSLSALALLPNRPRILWADLCCQAAATPPAASPAGCSPLPLRPEALSGCSGRLRCVRRADPLWGMAALWERYARPHSGGRPHRLLGRAGLAKQGMLPVWSSAGRHCPLSGSSRVVSSSRHCCTVCSAARHSITLQALCSC